MVKPVWNPSTLLEKGSGRLCLINQGMFSFWDEDLIKCCLLVISKSDYYPGTSGLWLQEGLQLGHTTLSEAIGSMSRMGGLIMTHLV